jgi:hypothetical protein
MPVVEEWDWARRTGLWPTCHHDFDAPFDRPVRKGRSSPSTKSKVRTRYSTCTSRSNHRVVPIRTRTGKEKWVIVRLVDNSALYSTGFSPEGIVSKIFITRYANNMARLSL